MNVTLQSIVVRIRKPEASKWMSLVWMKRAVVSQDVEPCESCPQLPFLNSPHPSSLNFAFLRHLALQNAVLISSTLRNLVDRFVPCSDHANAVSNRPTSNPGAPCRPDPNFAGSIPSYTSTDEGNFDVCCKQIDVLVRP